MSHPAATLKVPLACGYKGASGNFFKRDWVNSAVMMGFLKKLPALPSIEGSGSLDRRMLQTASATSAGLNFSMFLPENQFFSGA